MSGSGFVFEYNRIRLLQYLNFCASFGIACYLTYFNFNGRADQFWQLSYISVLLIIITTASTIFKRVLIVLAILVAILWEYNDIIDCEPYIKPLGASFYYTVNIIGAFIFMGGLLFAASVVKEDHKHCGVDLYIYLFTMNIMCFFKRDQFDSELHTLFDIRLLMVIFKALNSLDDISQLLYSNSFVIALILELVEYIFSGADHASGRSYAAGMIIYGCVGFILWYEGYKYLLRDSSEIHFLERKDSSDPSVTESLIERSESNV